MCTTNSGYFRGLLSQHTLLFVPTRKSLNTDIWHFSSSSDTFSNRKKFTHDRVFIRSLAHEPWNKSGKKRYKYIIYWSNVVNLKVEKKPTADNHFAQKRTKIHWVSAIMVEIKSKIQGLLLPWIESAQTHHAVLNSAVDKCILKIKPWVDYKWYKVLLYITPVWAVQLVMIIVNA